MPNASRSIRWRPSRFPAREFARAILSSVAATCIFVFLFMNPWRHRKAPVTNGVGRIGLVQKDSAFRVVPADRGGASGAVWYKTTGPGFPFQLRARGLTPGVRYLIELSVDTTIYDITSHTASPSGEISLDTTLTSFAEGACVGANYDAPRPLTGRHDIKFWVKRDGNPRSGTNPGAKPGAPGANLPCAGNGDGNYAYVLLEDNVAEYQSR